MTETAPTVRGVLFDKDGTLIDYHASFMPLNWALARTLAGGNEARARELMIMTGWDAEIDRVRSGSPMAAWTLREFAEFIHPEVEIDDLEETYRIVRAAYDTAPDEAVPVTDLPALLGALRTRSLKLGIVTSDHTAAAHQTVTRFGISEYMDFIAGYDAGHGAKPGPGMMTAFCAAHGLDPATVMVVGDNRHDMEFARNGGAGWAVGVLTGTSTREDLAPIADHVLDSVVDLPTLLDALMS